MQKDKKIQVCKYILMVALSLSFSGNLIADANSDIREDIDDLKDDIETIDERISSVNSSINNVNNTISEYNTKTYNAINYANQLPGRISYLNDKIVDYDEEIAEHKENEDSYDQQKSVVLSNQKDVKSEIEVLANSIFNLSNQIDLRKKEKQDLLDLSLALSEITSEVDYIESRSLIIEELLKESLLAHNNWIGSLNTHTQNHTPDWDAVLDIDSYKEAYESITTYWDNVPTQSNVENVEGELLLNANLIADKYIELADEIRAIPEHEGISVLKSQGKDEILALLMDIDENIEKQYSVILRSLGVPPLLKEKRSLLSITIYNSWIRLIGARLTSQNIISGSELINTINTDISALNTYSTTRSKLTNYEKELSSLLRSYYAPRLTKRKALVSLKMVEDMQYNLNNSTISGSIKSELSAMLIDFNSSYQRSLDGAVAALEDESRYFDQRIGRVELYLDRYSDRMTAICNDFASDYILSEASDVKHEMDYMEFRSSCL